MKRDVKLRRSSTYGLEEALADHQANQNLAREMLAEMSQTEIDLAIAQLVTEWAGDHDD